MSDCTPSEIEFPRCRGRRVVADFGGGDISSKGGALLPSAADRRLGLLSGLSRRLVDGRQAGKVGHKLLPLLHQRVYAVALGHEGANDHEDLRDDLVLQTAVGCDRRLASPSTVDRLDRAADHAGAVLALLVKRLRQRWPDVRIILRADRLILSSLAYGPIEAIRRLALEDTDMARAQAGTIGLKRLKIGAVVIRNTRRVALHLSTACPDKALFHLAAAQLKPG